MAGPGEGRWGPARPLAAAAYQIGSCSHVLYRAAEAQPGRKGNVLKTWQGSYRTREAGSGAGAVAQQLGVKTNSSVPNNRALIATVASFSCSQASEAGMVSCHGHWLG
eukprot:2481812-Rhodomonas_salina.1